MNDHARGLFITLIGVLVLTPDSLLVRLVDNDPWVISLARGIGVGVVIFAFFGLKDGFKTLLPGLKETGKHGIFASLCYATSSLCFVLSLHYTTAANLLVILAASPMFATILSRILLKEKPAMQTVIAIFGVICGVLIVFHDGLTSASGGIGEVLALMAALALSLNLTLIRMKRGANMVLANGLGSFIMAVIALPLALQAGYSLTGAEAGYLALLSLVVLPISFILIAIGPRYITSAEVGLIMVLETILGPIWVWLVVDETPRMWGFIGGAVVLLVLGWHSWWRINQSRSHKARKPLQFPAPRP